MSVMFHCHVSWASHSSFSYRKCKDDAMPCQVGAGGQGPCQRSVKPWIISSITRTGSELAAINKT
jgi:hypothetical protein